MFEEEQRKQVEGIVLTLKKLSETRWSSHKRAVDSVYISLPAIVQTLRQISEGNIPNSKLKAVSEAQGLLFQIKNFKFTFLLVMWKRILEKVYILSNYLQNSTICLVTAQSMIEVCFENINSMRTDGEFSEIKKNAIVLSEKFDGNTQFNKHRNKKKKVSMRELMMIQYQN